MNLSAEHVADQLYNHLGELVKAGILFHFADAWNSVKGSSGAPKLLQDLAASVVSYPESKVELIYRDVLAGGRLPLFESIFEILALKEQRALASFLGVRVDKNSVFFVPEPRRFFHEILLAVARHLHSNPFIFANTNSDIPLALDIIVSYIPNAVRVAMMSTIKLQQLCDRRHMKLGDSTAEESQPQEVAQFIESVEEEESQPTVAPADHRLVTLMDDGTIEPPPEAVPVSTFAEDKENSSERDDDSDDGNAPVDERQEEEKAPESEADESEEETESEEEEEKEEAPPKKEEPVAAKPRGRSQSRPAKAAKPVKRKRRDSSTSSRGSFSLPSSDQISGMVSKMLSDGTAQNILGKITGGAGIDGLLNGITGGSAPAPAQPSAPPQPAVAKPAVPAGPPKSAWS